MKLSLFRRIFAIFLCLLIIVFSLLIFDVSAHAGRTDENGGHTDSDTGEYHYHHGYPAHAHYDMDGDGDIDCPFDFNDQTSHASGTSGGSGSSTSGDGDPYKSGYSDGYEKGYIDGENDGYAEGYADGKNSGYAEGYGEAEKTLQAQAVQDVSKAKKTTFWLTLTIISVFFVPTLFFSSQRHRRNIEDLKKRSTNQINKEEETIALLRSDMSKLCAFIRRQVSFKSQSEFRFYFDIYGADDFEIPEDVYFVNYYVPVKGKISGAKPFGDFTVFVPNKGSCYHTTKSCSGILSSAVHIYDVANTYRPCPKCAKSKQYCVPEWYLDIKRIMDNNSQK